MDLIYKNWTYPGLQIQAGDINFVKLTNKWVMVIYISDHYQAFEILVIFFYQ